MQIKPKERECAREKGRAPVGEKFGEWVVLRYAKSSYWQCKCSCGAEHPVRIANLKNGTSRRCIDCQRAAAKPPPNVQKVFCEIGKTYGKWKVLKDSQKPGSYICRCETCGQTVKERRSIHLIKWETYGKQCRKCAAIESGYKQRQDPKAIAPTCEKHNITKVRVNDKSRASGSRWSCPACNVERQRRYRGVPEDQETKSRKKRSQLISGKTCFGNWTYLGIDPKSNKNRKYLVRCICGFEGTRESQALEKGRTLECRSCYEKGRLRKPQRNDITGLVIGKLTCISFSHNAKKANGNKGSAVWNWRCHCGKITKRTRSGLESDQLKSTSDVSCKSCSIKNQAKSREKDYTGTINGSLICTRRIELDKRPSSALWEWQCKCGNIIRRTFSSVIQNNTQSCGCESNNGADRAGERFGSLVAIKSIGKRVGESTYTWLFQCDCGNLHEARLRDCVQGKIRSCGCQPRGNDTIERWINSSFHKADQLQYLYVYPLSRFKGYSKPGISENLRQRESNAKGEYADLYNFIELTRLDAWLIEQAVLHETRLLAECPEELVNKKWPGWTEVRKTDPRILFDLMCQLHDELVEIGQEQFAINHIPMTPQEKSALNVRAGSIKDA